MVPPHPHIIKSLLNIYSIKLRTLIMIGMFSGYIVVLVPGVELVSFAEQVLLE